jgi:hypothetical protein
MSYPSYVSYSSYRSYRGHSAAKSPALPTWSAYFFAGPGTTGATAGFTAVGGV